MDPEGAKMAEDGKASNDMDDRDEVLLKSDSGSAKQINSDHIMGNGDSQPSLDEPQQGKENPGSNILEQIVDKTVFNTDISTSYPETEERPVTRKLSIFSEETEDCSLAEDDQVLPCSDDHPIELSEEQLPDVWAYTQEEANATLGGDDESDEGIQNDLPTLVEHSCSDDSDQPEMMDTDRGPKDAASSTCSSSDAPATEKDQDSDSMRKVDRQTSSVLDGEEDISNAGDTNIVPALVYELSWDTVRPEVIEYRDKDSQQQSETPDIKSTSSTKDPVDGFSDEGYGIFCSSLQQDFHQSEAGFPCSQDVDCNSAVLELSSKVLSTSVDSESSLCFDMLLHGQSFQTESPHVEVTCDPPVPVNGASARDVPVISDDLPCIPRQNVSSSLPAIRDDDLEDDEKTTLTRSSTLTEPDEACDRVDEKCDNTSDVRLEQGDVQDTTALDHGTIDETDQAFQLSSHEVKIQSTRDTTESNALPKSNSNHSAGVENISRKDSFLTRRAKSKSFSESDTPKDVENDQKTENDQVDTSSNPDTCHNPDFIKDDDDWENSEDTPFQFRRIRTIRGRRSSTRTGSRMGSKRESRRSTRIKSEGDRSAPNGRQGKVGKSLCLEKCCSCLIQRSSQIFVFASSAMVNKVFKFRLDHVDVTWKLLSKIFHLNDALLCMISLSGAALFLVRLYIMVLPS